MVDLAGETNSSLTLNNVVIADSANYQVVISNASGTVSSDIAALVVGYPASLTVELANITVSAGHSGHPDGAGRRLARAALPMDV